MYNRLALRSRICYYLTIADVKSLDFNVIRFLLKLFKSATMDIINNCLVHLDFHYLNTERRNLWANLFVVTICLAIWNWLDLAQIISLCIWHIYIVNKIFSLIASLLQLLSIYTIPTFQLLFRFALYVVLYLFYANKRQYFEDHIVCSIEQ